MGTITRSINQQRMWLPSMRLPRLALYFLGTLLSLVIISLSGYQWLYLNRAYPGVEIAGMRVGGLTAPAIERILAPQGAIYLNRPLRIKAGGELFTLTGAELGLQFDAALTAAQAYAIGRESNLVTNWLTPLGLLLSPQTVDPVFRYDESATHQFLQELARSLHIPPQDATLLIHDDGLVEVTPSRWGRQIHLEGTRPLIEQAILRGDTQPVEVVMQRIMPTVREIDLEPARQQALDFVERPLQLSYTTEDGEIQWSLEPNSMRGLLSLVQTVDYQQKTHFSVSLSAEQVEAYLKQVAPSINSDPVDAAWRADSETGELVITQPSYAGRELDVEAAATAIMAWAEQRDGVVELPIIRSPATYSAENFANLGIKEVVAESTSYFSGSSYGRRNNIELAASKFNGLIIPPGELFSFNHFLGEISAEAGYDESLIISGNRTAVGVGGGVCQVSTTVFRAAFFGGFEIVERWAHGYRVSWYETNSGPGLDATIYTPDVDFKFRNDSAYHLLLQTETNLDLGTLTFRFFSTASGRMVDISEPYLSNEVEHGPPIYEPALDMPLGATRQVDWAKNGLDVTVTRVVSESGTILHDDTIFSRYYPWRAIYKVGTGGAPPDPRRPIIVNGRPITLTVN